MSIKFLGGVAAVVQILLGGIAEAGYVVRSSGISGGSAYYGTYAEASKVSAQLQARGYGSTITYSNGPVAQPQRYRWSVYAVHPKWGRVSVSRIDTVEGIQKYVWQCQQAYGNQGW